MRLPPPWPRERRDRPVNNISPTCSSPPRMRSAEPNAMHSSRSEQAALMPAEAVKLSSSLSGLSSPVRTLWALVPQSYAFLPTLLPPPS